MNIITTKKRIVTLLAMVGCAALLSGCGGHQNPIQKIDPDTTAQFLVSASQYAEKQLHVFNAPGGYYYGECMTGKQKPSFCSKFYTAMARYGKTTQFFKGITVSDLSNRKTFNAIKEDYERVRFDTI